MTPLSTLAWLFVACGTATPTASPVSTDPAPMAYELAPLEVAVLDGAATDLALLSTPDERVWLAAVVAGDTLVRQFDVEADSLEAGQTFDLSDATETAAVALVLDQGLIPTVMTVDSDCRVATGAADRDLVTATDVTSCSAGNVVGGAVALGGVNPFSGGVDVDAHFLLTEVKLTDASEAPINRAIATDGSETRRWFWNQSTRPWSELQGTHGGLATMESDNDLVWGIDGDGESATSYPLPLTTSEVGYAVAYASGDDYFLVDSEQGSIRVHAFTYDDSDLTISLDEASEVAGIEGVPSNTHLRVVTVDRGFAVIWHEAAMWNVRLFRVVLGGDVDLVGSVSTAAASQVDLVQVSASELSGGETVVTIAEASPTALTIRGVVLP